MPEHTVISGPAGSGVYSQALVCGNFYLAFNLIDGAESVNLDLGRNTVSKIEEICSQSPEIKPSELTEILSEEFSQNIKLNISAAKIEGNKLFAAVKGEAEVKLIRQQKVINLLSRDSSISGPVLKDDLLVLGTKDFFQSAFSLSLLTSGGLSDFKDALSMKIESLPDNSKISAILVRMDPEEPLPPTEISSKLPENPRPSIPFKKNVFLRSSIKFHLSTLASGQSKRTLYFAGLVLIVLISFIAFQLRSRNLEMRNGVATAIEKEALSGLDSANKLEGLNDTIARDILIQTRTNFLNKTVEEFGENWQTENSLETNKLKNSLAIIDNQLAVVSHAYILDKLDVFSDFNLLRANANITSVTLYANEILAVDTTNGSAYSLGTKSKSAAIIGGSEDFKNKGQIDFLVDNAFVFTTNGIYSINRNTNSTKLLVKPSDKWKNIQGLKTFAGNIYLLDTNASQIWKYQGTDFGFDEISSYLRAGGLDLSKTAGFAIDGSIYVLTTSGNIVKFSAGYGDSTFNVSGLDKPLKDPVAIFTSDEVENVYILDKGNSRVVILNKNGSYQAQYTFPDISSNLILADETVKKVFLISGSKVYSFDLK